MRYRNIQGLRAIAALMVFCSHLFWDIAPMRTHRAKPWVTAIGLSGVDIFFVISGFIVYQVMGHSAAQVAVVGHARAALGFAMKRILRIYPLYWIVFAAAALIMTWAPLPASVSKKPALELFLLINGIPNFRVPAAWTLTFEVYFYAVTALSILLFGRKAFVGLSIWFTLVACVALLSAGLGTSIPLDYVFAPIVLEFLLGMVIAGVVAQGERRLPLAAIAMGIGCLGIGAYVLHLGGARVASSYPLRLLYRGMPAALIVYGAVALELRNAWSMPKAWQYLGDASYSIYLWHGVIFYGVASLFLHWGWVGAISPSLLTLLMAAIGLGAGLLSYHVLERPLLRVSRAGRHALARGPDRVTHASHSLTQSPPEGVAHDLDKVTWPC